MIDLTFNYPITLLLYFCLESRVNNNNLDSRLLLTLCHLLCHSIM